MMHGTVLVSCITRALYRVCGSMIHSACGLSADDLCCCCCCEATVCDHQDHQPIGSRSTYRASRLRPVRAGDDRCHMRLVRCRVVSNTCRGVAGQAAAACA
jgi:hypothetical protein